MYATPTLTPLDLATTTASCCRVYVQVGENEYTFTNRPLCPFPLDTGDLCFNDGSATTSAILLNACVYAN